MNPFRSLADYVALQRRFYGYTRENIHQHQWRAVEALLAVVREKSPFYQDRYRDREVRSLAEFAKLPTIHKAAMMENFDRLNTAGLKKDELVTYAVEKELARDYLGYYAGEYVVGLSSGTSGAKGIYVTPKSLTERLPAVFLARGGIPLRLLPFRILFLLRVFSQGFADIRAPLISLTYLSTMTDPTEIVERMNADRINVLMAPPSLLRVLLPHIGKIRVKPKRVVSYAEVLEREEKERLQRAFGCPVVEIYQASEGPIGSACRRGTLHLNEDLVYVELFDEGGDPVTEPEKTARRMIITNLLNTVQPLIRYEMNDFVELGGPCPCGSRFRSIAKVIGRNDDVFVFRAPDGTIRPVFPDLISRWIITSSDAIREYRVEQHGAGDLDVTVETTGESDQAAVEAALVQRFRTELSAFGIAAPVRVRFEKIPLLPDNRKFKRFVREDAATSAR
jgi:putative adenylate-forming enzyme